MQKKEAIFFWIDYKKEVFGKCFFWKQKEELIGRKYCFLDCAFLHFNHNNIHTGAQIM